ncbi:MAG: hypothetical protein WBO09_19640 [Methylocystis silviterrae]
MASKSRSVAARPHVLELDFMGAGIWIWRDTSAGMFTAIIGALKALS